MRSAHHAERDDYYLRSGISLLEVLISMFVLAVGLLGLASMVPVGQFQVQQASNSDAATAVGLDAFRQIKVLDMMDEATWVYLRDITPVTVSAFAPGGSAYIDLNSDGNYDAGEPDPDTIDDEFWDGPASFVIDPLGVTTNATSAAPSLNFCYFPYGDPTITAAAASAFTTAPVFPKPWRISILDMGTAAAINRVTADRIFRATDDKIFDLPADDLLRPVLVNVGESVQTQSRGDYSWMAMITPVFWFDTTEGPATQIIPGLGTTSVIVFHKRDLTNLTTPTSERFEWADVLSSGPGTIDVQLREMTLSGSLTAAEEELKVRPLQWVMLSAQLPFVPAVAATATTLAIPAIPAIPVHRWFRVVTAGEVTLLDPTSAASATNPYVRELTLAGPDLNFYTSATASRYVDADGVTTTAPAPNATIICTICDGVIGVFEKTVQLDEPSLWTAH